MTKYTVLSLFIFVSVSFCLPLAVRGQGKQIKVSESMQGHIFKPAQVDATNQNVKQLKLPAGFTIAKYAENVGKPRMLAVTPDGTVYVTDRENGTVTMLRDTNKDWKADEKKVVAKKENMHGITFQGNQVYLVTAHEVFSANINQDGTFGALKEVIKDLPEAGQHNNRTAGIGPDGMLYVTVGSTCNACEETSKENATILQMKPDGSGRRIYAKGVRNTIGFDWHPVTKEFYGFDHGMDWMGDDAAQEELNIIKDGGNYGWPYVYENGTPNKSDQPKEGDWATYAKQTVFPALLYTAHSAPLGFKFYTGNQFPADYKNDAFVTMHGSWNRKDPTGYSVVRVRFQNGQPVKFENFLTGFLINKNQEVFGRVCGITQHPDGSLLISDDMNGVIYRVAYAGKK